MKKTVLLAALLFTSPLFAAPPTSRPATKPIAAAIKLPTGVKLIADIPYIDHGDPAQKLDIYEPTKKPDKPLPLIVFVHGGGWSGGSKSGGAAMWWVARGYVTASIEYRFSQVAKFPAQIQDCQAALRWLRAHAADYDIEPTHVGITGGSAGGHLVALMGVTGGKRTFPAIGSDPDQSDKVDAVLDYFGPSDFTDVTEQAIKEPVKNIFPFNTKGDPYSMLIGGARVGETNDQSTAVSPVTYVTPGTPPFLILHGTHDKLVPFAQSVELKEKLEQVGTPVMLQPIPDAGHGGPQFDLPPAKKLTIDFFAKYLQGKDVTPTLVPLDDLKMPATQPATAR